MDHASAFRLPLRSERGASKGIGRGSKLNRRGKPQVLVQLSTCQGSILEFRFSEPQSIQPGDGGGGGGDRAAENQSLPLRLPLRAGRAQADLQQAQGRGRGCQGILQDAH